jgi:hypothetical protein
VQLYVVQVQKFSYMIYKTYLVVSRKYKSLINVEKV